MLFDVKNTTLRIISDLICPHYCSLCGKIGSLLCDCCKNDLCTDYANHCLSCGAPIHDHCPVCTLPFSGQWTFSFRDANLKKMISRYKFESVRSFGETFAALIDSILPQLPPNTIIVPMPTIRRHIRERGFDHALLLAKALARRRHLSCEPILGRAKNTIQVGSDRQTRLAQAKHAYKLIAKINPESNYLVIDDVWTTGASICSACELLGQNGAHRVMVAVLARSV